MTKVLCTIGDPNAIGPEQNAGAAVGEFNNFLSTIGVSIGVILLVVGLIKIVLSALHENPKEKQDASMLIGISIMFISMTQVLNFLQIENVNENTTPGWMAAQILRLIGSVLSYGGVILLILAILSLILSITQENPEQQASGTKLLVVAIGLVSISSATNLIASYVGSENQVTDASMYLTVIISWIAVLMTYAGAGFAILGVFRLVLSIRNEDPKEKDVAIRFLMVGIALLSFRAILGFFGLEGFAGLQSFDIQIEQKPGGGNIEFN